MGRIDNVNTSEIQDILRRLRQLETRSPGGNTSVTEGRLRIAGPDSLLVEGSGRVSGQLYIDGLEVVSGELRVTGTFNMDGDANVSGTMDVSGPLTVQGNTTFIGPMRVEGKSDFIGMMVVQGESQFVGEMSIEGPVTITGQTTVTGELIVQGDVEFTGKTILNGDTEFNGNTKLTGDMTVTGGGKVKVGTMLLDPTGGALGNGSIYSSVALELTAPTVVTSSALFAEGSITTQRYLSAPGTTALPGVSANLFMDSNGRIYRVA